MKIRFLLFAGLSIVLVGCQRQPTTLDTSTTSHSVAETTQSNLIYFQYLVEKYQIAVEYSKNNKNVQSPSSALEEAYEKLKQEYTSDIQVINKNYYDLRTLLDWNGDAWEKSLTQWADELKQHYEQINHKNFEKQNSLTRLLQKATVKHKQVNWNIFGVTDTNSYDYLILDAYQDVYNGHLYLFTIQSGQPVVLYMNGTVEQIENSDFEPTQNEELTKVFNNFLSSTSRRYDTTKLSKKIETVMHDYTSDNGESYHAASPATQKKYYGLASPDQVFKYGKVNGRSVIFKWNDWIVGESGDTYEIQACYVNDSGTEVILFCYQDEKLKIFHTIGEPVIQKSESGTIESATVNFEELNVPVLKSSFD